jgi:hypothetical protein
MRYLILSFIALVAICNFSFSQTSSTYSAADLSGTYELRKLNEPNGEVITIMRITFWENDNFLIRGQGWVGTGKLKGKEGYYDWKFDDGKSGRTTFKLNNDGSLNGSVKGSGIDWDYIAKRSTNINYQKF